MIAHPLPWCRLDLLKIIYAELKPTSRGFSRVVVQTNAWIRTTDNDMTGAVAP